VPKLHQNDADLVLAPAPKPPRLCDTEKCLQILKKSSLLRRYQMSSLYFTTAIFLGAPSAWKSLIAKKIVNKKCLFLHVPQSSARSFAYRHN
jgi:hypothetical protein